MSLFRGFFVFALLVVSAISQAEGVRSRVDGTLGGGPTQYAIQSPASGFNLNPGLEFNMQAEKPLGSTPFYLVFSASYSKSSGTLNYNYTSSQANYLASNVNFSLDEYRADLGIRLKFFDSHIIRPYLEGGATGGYLQFSYDSSLRTPAVVAAGTDYRTFEGALEIGYYAEGGLEVEIGNDWGIRLGYHRLVSTTRTLNTFGAQTITYTGTIYYGGLFWGI